MVHVTTIIPAYNAEQFLAEAIESVLNQTAATTIEIIVIDDGSTDATAQVAKSFSTIKYFHQANGGAASARNNGLQKCTSEFICFLDADDQFIADKLEKQLQRFEDDPTLDAVFGHVSEFLSAPSETHRNPVTSAPACLPSTMLARKTLLAKVGMFDTTLKVGEFVDWYSRATSAGMKHCMLPDLILRRRLHQNNLGLRESTSTRDYARILKAHLDRGNRRSAD